ncbi:MAG: PEP-CTERM sorting domain-containing protein [Rubrivivax sp.]
MNFIYRAISTAALLAASAAAPAAMVHVQFDNPIFSGVAAPAYDAVTIRFPGPGGGASVTANVAAGRFQGTASNLVGIDPSVLVDSAADLYLYCYDLYEHVGDGWSADYTVNFGGAAARTLDFLGAVNAVLSQSQSQVDPYAWLHPGNGLMAAAIQLGIWESKYDSGDDWSMGSGAFQASGLEAQTASYLAGFLAAMPGTASLDARYVMTFEAAGVQDMITGDPPSNVPEPGTLALAGLAGLALVRRRQRGAKSSVSTSACAAGV